jgi:hypothetical protein
LEIKQKMPKVGPQSMKSAAVKRCRQERLAYIQPFSDNKQPTLNHALLQLPYKKSY